MPPPASLSANYASQDFSSQFMHPNSMSYASFPGNVGFQDFSPPPEYFSGIAPSFLHQGQSSTSVPDFSGVQGSSVSSSMTAFTAQPFANGESWIVDTCASHHMSPDITLLHYAVPYDGDKQIIVGSGQCLTVQNIGHGTLQSHSHTL